MEREGWGHRQSGEWSERQESRRRRQEGVEGIERKRDRGTDWQITPVNRPIQHVRETSPHETDQSDTIPGPTIENVRMLTGLLLML